MTPTHDTHGRQVAAVERARPFCLSIDSGSQDEPGDRWFASLEAALAAWVEMDEKWKRWAWVTEQETRGGSVVIHMRDGMRETVG